MRLERIMYERLFNTKTLGRARVITKPTKINRETDFLLGATPDLKIYHVFDRFFRWVYAKEWNFMRDVTLQKGMAMEDMLIYDEEDFRRSPFHEHVLRESAHFYQHLLFGLRRSRYFKVDMVVKGCEAPHYIRDEANKRTYIDSFVNIFKWRHFLDSNYYNDITPITTWYQGSRSLLEIMVVYGFSGRSAWNRYFFNEEQYYNLDAFMVDLKEYNQPFYKNLDLKDPQQFEQWKKHVVQWNKQFPGYYAPGGEEVDFDELALKIENIRQELDLETITSDDLKSVGVKHALQGKPFVAYSYPGEDAKGSNNIGLELPKFIRRPSERAFMN